MKIISELLMMRSNLTNTVSAWADVFLSLPGGHADMQAETFYGQAERQPHSSVTVVPQDQGRVAKQARASV